MSLSLIGGVGNCDSGAHWAKYASRSIEVKESQALNAGESGKLMFM